MIIKQGEVEGVSIMIKEKKIIFSFLIIISILSGFLYAHAEINTYMTGDIIDLRDGYSAEIWQVDGENSVVSIGVWLNDQFIEDKILNSGESFKLGMSEVEVINIFHGSTGDYVELNINFYEQISTPHIYNPQPQPDFLTLTLIIAFICGYFILKKRH